MDHILLIGFKHVGKTTIGRELSRNLALPFVDIDDEIVAVYASTTGHTLTCREIFDEIGAPAFRDLEDEVFSGVLSLDERHVIATGGGLTLKNHAEALRTHHTVIHIECDKDTVFDRICANGRPAFLPADRPLRESFEELWSKRMPIYRACATHTLSVTNSFDTNLSAILAMDIFSQKNDNPYFTRSREIGN